MTTLITWLKWCLSAFTLLNGWQEHSINIPDLSINTKKSTYSKYSLDESNAKNNISKQSLKEQVVQQQYSSSSMQEPDIGLLTRTSYYHYSERYNATISNFLLHFKNMNI